MPDNPSPAWKNQAAAPSASKGEAAVPAWKKEAGGPAPGGPRAWQSQPAAPAPRPSSKITKLVAALGLLGLLAAAIVALLPYLSGLSPATVIVLGSSYDLNLSLPHNAHGWQGLNDLAKAAGLGKEQFEMRRAFPEGEPAEITDEASWQKQWQDARKASIRAKTVLLYLALHGGADDQGAYLFLNDPRLKAKVYVAALLDDIAKTWPKQNVVLILEPGPLDAHWHSGMLENKFVHGLKTAVDSAAKKHQQLAVLCGCDVDQVCWSSDEWRQTIFTHFVVEGLQGAAAGPDRRVHVGELFRYVKDGVAKWADTNRGVKQTPVLLGNDLSGVELTQVTEDYTERSRQDAPGLSAFAPSDDLSKAWTKCANLESKSHPWAYTPQQWRRYRDALVRWEQLERAGDPTGAADRLQTLCNKLAKEMEDAGRVPAGEREITRALPLPGSLGITPRWQREELKSRFALLWNASTAQVRQKTFEELMKWSNAGPDETKLLYLGLCRELLHHLATSDTIEGPEEVTATARDFVRFLEVQFQLPPRPAELHYLVMLSEGLDPKTLPPITDLKQALDVRLLAEQAALAEQGPTAATATDAAGPSYSEIVQPFIRARIEAADGHRRLAEDWLFGAGEKEWKRARDLHGKALEGYQEALKDAGVVQRAVEARNRALADLPYLAAWLGRRHAQQGGNDTAVAKLTGQVAALSRDIGDLTWCLLEPKVRDGFREPWNSERKREARTPRDFMEQLSLGIAEGRKTLMDEFSRHCNGLKQVDHQERWHELEAALSIPLADDAGLRGHLLDISHRLSQKLHQSDRPFAETERPPPDPNRAEDQKELALAALVTNWEDKHPVGLHAKANADQLAGKIGGYWLGMPDRITDQVKASDLATDLDAAALKMRDAEFLCRLLPGGVDLSPVSPPASMRRLRLHNLLVSQAERVKEDHWYDEKGLPYYVPVAKAYARFARDLTATDGKNEALAAARRSKTEALDKKLVAAGLKITPPANLDWTSELKFPLAWTLEADEGVPRGVPMYWLEFASQRADVEDERFGQRHAAEDWLPKTAPYSLARRNKVDPYAAPTKARLTALYRGQLLKEQEVALREWTPRTVVEHVPPRSAGLAFRMAPKFNHGAIAFVLDASGSMFNNRIKGKLRWEHAVAALDETLKKIPESTYVSLSIFLTKEKVGGVPVHETWRAPKLWKAEDREYLIDKLRALKVVQGASPIAKAIVRARDDNGFPPPNRYSGPKLIVALTDGDDTWSFDVEPRPDNRDGYNRRVSKYLREQLNDRQTEVHVVCFNEQVKQEDQEEAQRASDQFKVVEGFKPPGTFRTQTQPGDLAESLDRAIRPILKLQTGARPVPGFGQDPINRSGSALKWTDLAPGHYTVWVAEEHKQDVHLKAGDFMILTLHREGDKVYFKRTLLAEEFRDRLVAAEQTVKGLNAAVLRNQITPKGDIVRQLVAIEEPAPAIVGDIEQRRLHFVWLELKPKTGSVNRLVWQRDYSYAGPAFSLRAEGWPFEAGRAVPADLKAWSTLSPADHPSYAHTVEPDAVQSLRAKVSKALPLRVGNANIKIEDVAVETHEVSVGPNQRAAKPCLVFRISHEPQKPVFLQLRTPESYVLGEEHRYYPEANRYTAMFWNLPDLENARFAVNVISLADFQANAEPASFTLPRPTQAPGPDPVPIAVLP